MSILNVNYTWVVSCWKVPNVLSRCHIKRRMGAATSYQKKDGRVWPHPSFFWYDTDFLDFFKNNFSFGKSLCHTKRRMGEATCAHPSFGMTPTQNIMDLFAWCLITHELSCVCGICYILCAQLWGTRTDSVAVKSIGMTLADKLYSLSTMTQMMIWIVIFVLKMEQILIYKLNFCKIVSISGQRKYLMQPENVPSLLHCVHWLFYLFLFCLFWLNGRHKTHTTTRGASLTPNGGPK